MASTAVYATAAELRDRIDKTGTTKDAVLDALLSASSRAIDGFCNRPDGFIAIATATARTYPGSGKPYQWIDECISVTKVEVKDDPSDDDYTLWAAADWAAFSGDPEFPDFNSLPIRGLMVTAAGNYSVFTSSRYTTKRGFRPMIEIPFNVQTVRVTARWGYAASAPPQVREACIVQAARWFKRGESGWADALASPDGGQLFYRKSLDPDLQAMLVHARLVRPVV